jgi:flagellar biosynthesis/type III secretory pathway protein FliH
MKKAIKVILYIIAGGVLVYLLFFTGSTGGMSKEEKAFQEAYDEGYRAGYDEGYEDGLADGFDEGYFDAQYEASHK